MPVHPSRSTSLRNCCLHSLRDAFEELASFSRDEALRDAPVAICLNKQDRPHALSARDVRVE